MNSLNPIKNWCFKQNDNGGLINRKWIILLLITVFQSQAITLKGQQVMALYQSVPGVRVNDWVEIIDTSSKRLQVSHVTKPTLTVFLPEQHIATGTGVIICPGGAYSYVVMDKEGYEVARELAKKGVAAFVLKYRLPNDAIMITREIGPLQDAEQAIKIVRENAAKWKLDTHKIGIMGFSAGGHLASTLSTHYKRCLISNPDSLSLRPDFSILIYPVISFTDNLAHKGTKKALVGENATPTKIAEYSNELWVTSSTPPAFIMHCTDDQAVTVDNSLAYYAALKRN